MCSPPRFPLDRFNAAENAYLHLIQRADHYVYITTPYLILDNEFVTTLKTAAESGVDVRIITPPTRINGMSTWSAAPITRPSSKAASRSMSISPASSTPKCCLCDDKAAMVGTANLDYRSLYLHYENAVLLYHTPRPCRDQKDIEETLEKAASSPLRSSAANCAAPVPCAPCLSCWPPHVIPGGSAALSLGPPPLAGPPRFAAPPGPIPLQTAKKPPHRGSSFAIYSVYSSAMPPLSSSGASSGAVNGSSAGPEPPFPAPHGPCGNPPAPHHQ